VSPDEIHRALARHYPRLVAQRRKNPDGWAFYLDPPQKGAKSNRIIRVTRSSPNAVTCLKLAVSSRRRAKDTELEFAGAAPAGFARLRGPVIVNVRRHAWSRRAPSKTCRSFARGGDSRSCPPLYRIDLFAVSATIVRLTPGHERLTRPALPTRALQGTWRLERIVALLKPEVPCYARHRW